MRVGVIGCGTAGGAVAILLARAGHAVTVIERVAEPRPVGAGIILQPTGQTVLARLGLLEQVAARGARLDRLWLRTPSGRTLVDLHYAQIDPAWFGIGIHRGVLFEALYETVRADSRIALHTGCTIRELRGDHVRDATGTDHGPFDVVIVADGSLSFLRDELVTRDVAYPWGALWFVAEDRQRAFTRELYQVARGAKYLYGVLPTGIGPRGDVPLASLFWSVAARDLPALKARGLAIWKQDVLALDARIAPVLDQISSLDQLVFARYRDVAMSRWHDGRVVFIGDSAHATSPQLGQGANLALLDALVLADMLAQHPPAQALAAYSRTRRRHLRHYQRMTRWLTPLFQSSSPVFALARDVTFPIANALAPLRHHMIRTMAGVSLGLWRQPFTLPTTIRDK